jgi:hypothetical protein
METIYGKSDMLGMGSNAPAVEREIHQKLNELEKMNGELYKALEELDNRLTPIMSRPIVTPATEETKEMEAQCPLADVLRVRINETSNNIRRISYIISRLQV